MDARGTDSDAERSDRDEAQFDLVAGDVAGHDTSNAESSNQDQHQSSNLSCIQEEDVRPEAIDV